LEDKFHINISHSHPVGNVTNLIISLLAFCKTGRKKNIFDILHRLRVFENRVMKRISEHKRQKVTGKWRKLHNEELIICTLHQTLF
jgi:hypothetical protein